VRITMGAEETAMRAKKKSELKLAYREQARRKVRPSGSSGGLIRGFRGQVEDGRQHLLQVSSEGGDCQAKKVKNELMYLLNNYLPAYDARINSLIDAWRRSGDPAYDPSIRLKHRQARRDHMNRGDPA